MIKSAVLDVCRIGNNSGQIHRDDRKQIYCYQAAPHRFDLFIFYFFLASRTVSLSFSMGTVCTSESDTTTVVALTSVLLVVGRQNIIQFLVEGYSGFLGNPMKPHEFTLAFTT